MNLLKTLNYIPTKQYNPETADYRARVIANGGTISDTSIDAIEKFVQDCKNAMIWETARPYLYLRTTSDNRIIAGGRDIPFSNP